MNLSFGFFCLFGLLFGCRHRRVADPLFDEVSRMICPPFEVQFTDIFRSFFEGFELFPVKPSVTNIEKPFANFYERLQVCANRLFVFLELTLQVSQRLNNLVANRFGQGQRRFGMICIHD